MLLLNVTLLLPHLVPIAEDFPHVHFLAPDQVHDLLFGDTSNAKAIIVSDSRSPEEYEVSRIPDAINKPYQSPLSDFEMVLSDAKGVDTIITYCAHGRRAAVAATKYMIADGQLEAEFTEDEKNVTSVTPEADRKKGTYKVYAMIGSVFEYANLGYPLVDRCGQPTKFVYASENKVGLNPDLISTEPAVCSDEPVNDDPAGGSKGAPQKEEEQPTETATKGAARGILNGYFVALVAGLWLSCAVVM